VQESNLQPSDGVSEKLKMGSDSTKGSDSVANR
jgi:hypothetical protein